MFRKTLLIAAMIVGLAAAPALAQTDDYTSATIQVTVNDDGSLTVTGQGFTPNAPYTYTVTEVNNAQGFLPLQSEGTVVEEGAGTTDADGNLQFTTAQLGPGTYQVAVNGVTAADSSTATIQGDTGATGPSGDAGDESAAGALPDTGADSSIPLTRLGIILIAAGGLAVYAGTKRRGRRAAFINS